MTPAARIRRHQRQRGLTLVELLVSMVILGFVMALVSEAVFQVSQVARAASATTQALGARWASGWSISGLLANLVAPELPAAEPVMQGSPTRLAGYSTLPVEGIGGIRNFELMMRTDPADPGRTAVMWSGVVAPGSGPAAEPAVVASLPGRTEFAFLRRNGELIGEWPPLTRSERDAEDLPRAVLIREAGTGRHLMWYDCPGEPTRPKPITNFFGSNG